MSPALLETRGFSHRFGDLLAVDDVTMHVEPGEVVGLLGANGAGKTTLIRALLGLVGSADGQVRLLGGPPSRQARMRVGYVPQGMGLYDDLTVAQNLEFTARAYRASVPELPPDLAEHSDALVGSLALGSQRRLAFVCALLHDPEVLVLDEPTSGVDPLARARLWDTVRERAEAGVGVLITTHYMQEAQQCDRLLLMAGGRLVGAGSEEDVVGRHHGRRGAHRALGGRVRRPRADRRCRDPVRAVGAGGRRRRGSAAGRPGAGRRVGRAGQRARDHRGADGRAGPGRGTVSPRRAPGESRRAILEAARRQFAAVGYQRATIRAIARAAGVDPALVIQYFGSKDELLDASLEMPVDIAAVTADLDSVPGPGDRAGPPGADRVGHPPIRNGLLAMLRTGLSHQRASEALAAMVSRSVLGVVERFATGEDARFRAALVGSQIAGLAMGRLALQVPELTETSPDRIARAVGPTITRYLTGDISGGPGADGDGTPAV